jgi:hypothetical protein
MSLHRGRCRVICGCWWPPARCRTYSTHGQQDSCRTWRACSRFVRLCILLQGGCIRSWILPASYDRRSYRGQRPFFLGKAFESALCVLWCQQAVSGPKFYQPRTIGCHIETSNLPERKCLNGLVRLLALTRDLINKKIIITTLHNCFGGNVAP